MNSLRLLSSAATFIAIIAGGTAAGAQRIGSNAPFGVSRHVGVETRMQDSASVTGKRDYAGNTTFRVFTSLLTSGAGLVAGAYAGANMEGPCACDDPGLEGAILGGLSGMIVGAAIGAAAPSMTSTCSFGERLARTVGGSLVGGFIGIGTFILVQQAAGLVLMPVSTTGGAVMGLGRCR